MAVAGFIITLVGGLLMIVGAVRMVERTTVKFAVMVCATTILIGVGFLIRAADLPIGSGWFVATITGGLLWISAAALYAFVYRRALSRSSHHT